MNKNNKISQEKKDIKVLFSNTLMLFLLQISGYIFPLITFPYITRKLGPEYYGVVVFMYSFMAFFQILLDFGFTLSGTLKCSLNRDDKEKLGIVTFSIIQGKIILSLLGLLVLILTMLFSNIMKDKELFALLSYIPVFLALFIPDFLFRGIEKMSIITYRTLLSNSIYVILIIILVNEPSDYLLIPLILGFSTLVTIVWSWYYLIKVVNIPIKFVGMASVIESLKESKEYFLSRIATTLYNSSNIFLLGLIGFNSASIGNYGVANNLINTIKSMLTPISDSIYPYMVRNKNFKLIWLIIIISFPVIFIGVSVFYYFADFIVVTLCGAKFHDAVLIFKWMLPLILIMLPTYLLGFPMLGAMGHSSKANTSVIVGSLFHVIGLLLLFLFSKIIIIKLIVLTIFTELLILFIRIYYVIKFKSSFSNELV